MDIKLKSILNQDEGNHMLPFFWIHSGERHLIRDQVRTVYDSGARALCVESRPHEHFGEDEWWGDMDVILDEAQKLGMKVWVLDDKKFPTGYANGLVSKKYPERRKVHLIEDHVDMVGPQKECMLLFNPIRDGVHTVMADGDELVGAYAYKHLPYGEKLVGEPIDLTANVRGDFLIWDVPDGVWRVFFLIKTRRFAMDHLKDFMHMIDRESVSTLIEAVYEPHYQHYGHLFGTTFAGFFSDEPCFGNDVVDKSGYCGTMYDKVIGTYSLSLPWSAELLDRLNGKIGCNALPYLPLLWYDRVSGDGPSTSDMRVAYMDVVTALWRENFSYQIGDWCRAHGVEYIGHIIEDMNAHTHLSCTGGHFFRSLDGQDMSGMDFVLHQYAPGMDHYPHSATCAGYATDPEFYHYTLAKLTASHAHLQPRMRGRAMCEAFGAFGWSEGSPFMKAMMDHLLVRGVNHFVPHAFSMKYPDPDCPPHFNGGGMNPEFPAFAKLMQYSNRIADLLCGAEHIADTAILYHAEAEWGSAATIGQPFMLTQKPACKLYDRQIDYDIVPADFIMDGAEVRDGKLVLGRACCEAGEERRCLIVPGTRYLPARLIARLEELCAQGLKLIFVNERPADCSCGEVIELDALADTLIARGWAEVQLDKLCPMLRVMHVRRGSAHIFMFVNESVRDRADVKCTLPVSGDYVRLDVQLDGAYRGCCDGSIHIDLAPGQSMLYVFDAMQGQPEYDALPADADYQGLAGAELQLSWRISAADHTALDSYRPLAETKLVNMTGFESELGPGFSGCVRYETTLHVDDAARVVTLDLGEANDCAQITLNGEPLEWRMAAPYVWNVEGKLRDGDNELCVTVANTLCGAVRDNFSHYVQMPRTGLFGPVKMTVR